MMNENKITSLQPEQGAYALVPLEWFGNPYGADVGVISYPFQRGPRLDRINQFKEYLLKQKERTGKFYQAGILHIAFYREDPNEGPYRRYILDGQHRLYAYRDLGTYKNIMIQCWIVNDMEEMRKCFIAINSNVPIEEYIDSQ